MDKGYLPLEYMGPTSSVCLALLKILSWVEGHQFFLGESPGRAGTMQNFI